MRLIICLVGVIMAGSAHAAPPAIVTQGSGSAAACAACHGLDGSGNAAEGAAVLAQLPAPYFIKQLNDFKSGARTHPVMTPIAQALSDTDIAAAAKYYAALPRPKISSGASPESAASANSTLGENLARNGAWGNGTTNRQIPACFKCHGEDGQGVPPAFPPIAGQHASYTVNQLQAWKTGTRSNDPQMLMKSVAERLTDEEIQAVAEYLASTSSTPTQAKNSKTTTPVKNQSDVKKSAPISFTPPDESTIPQNEFGEMVLLGKNIFVNTQQYAKKFVGNGLNCTNCHLDNGRKADSAPLWAAYVLYPAYRKKTKQVDTIQSRIQGCFLYSMDGKPPAFDSKEMTALVSYHYWLASGAPTGVKLPGQGFIKVPMPQKPDMARGAEVYKNNCAICHGENGQGTLAQGTGENGKYAFPPLWGKDSFNWGAGMHRVDTAAGFIKANMPYGRGGSLSDQQAWDVALFMNSQQRPQDPRFNGSMTRTRDKEHDEICLYGRSPDDLMKLLDKQATAKSDSKAADPQQQNRESTQGYSPAVAH